MVTKTKDSNIIASEEELKSILEDYKENPTTQSAIKREVEILIEEAKSYPPKESGQLVRERQYRINKIGKAITLINLDVPLPKEHEKIKLILDKDLKNIEIKKIEWIISDIIPEKAICFLGGKRGTFKTFFGLELAYSIASGKIFLNKFESKKARVLFIDEESGLSLIKERGEKIKKGLGITEDVDVAFISFANIKLDSSIWVIKLREVIEEFKPNLIIVDSLRRVMRFDENEAGYVSKLFTDSIRPLTEDYNLSWLLLHHMRKGMSGKYVTDEMDELRGSSDLANYADIIIVLNRNRGATDSIVFKQVKCRYKEEMSAKVVKFDWGEDSLKMECVGDAEESNYADELCSKLIIAWMGEEQKTSFKTKEAMDAMKLQRQSKATIDRALKALVESGRLIKPQKGVYELNVITSLDKYASMPQMPQDASDTKNNNESQDSKYKDIEALRHKIKPEIMPQASDSIYSEACDSSDSSLKVEVERV